MRAEGIGGKCDVFQENRENFIVLHVSFNMKYG